MHRVLPGLGRWRGRRGVAVPEPRQHFVAGQQGRRLHQGPGAEWEADVLGLRCGMPPAGRERGEHPRGVLQPPALDDAGVLRDHGDRPQDRERGAPGVQRTTTENAMPCAVVLGGFPALSWGQRGECSKPADLAALAHVPLTSGGFDANIDELYGTETHGSGRPSRARSCTTQRALR